MSTQILKYLITLALSATLALGTDDPQSRPLQPDQLAQEIETIIDQAQLGRFWGSALVRVGDQTVFARGFGYETSELTPIDPTFSLFDVGSISKSVTAATILRLIEQDKLSLSTTVAEIFPLEAGNLSSITIEQLLRHQSGLGAGIGMFAPQPTTTTRPASPIDTPEALVAAAGRVGLGTEHFTYSNPGYFVLAAIIERVSEQPFEEAVRQLVFEPAGLTRIGFVGDGQIDNARPTVRISQSRYGPIEEGSLFGYPWNWGQRGATGVVTTAQTAADWFEAIETGGWLSADSREAMLDPISIGYGLGLYVDANEDGTISRFWHSGSTGGYQCHAVRYPLTFDGQGATVVLMTQSSIHLDEINRKIRSLIAPQAPRPIVGGLYLNNLDEFKEGSVYTVDHGLRWKGNTQYIGSDGVGRIVDQRPTLILEHQSKRMWTLILRIDEVRVRSLIEELERTSTQIAKDPEGGATPWSKGTTLVADAQSLTLTEHQSHLLGDGTILSVQATADHHVALVISAPGSKPGDEPNTEPNTKKEIARVLMGGAEVRQLKAQLTASIR